MSKKSYILVKDRHPRISEVLNDCVSLCVSASKDESLGSILQKLCAKIAAMQAEINDLKQQVEALQN